jgi:hypothetical protein
MGNSLTSVNSLPNLTPAVTPGSAAKAVDDVSANKAVAQKDFFMKLSINTELILKILELICLSLVLFASRETLRQEQRAASFGFRHWLAGADCISAAPVTLVRIKPSKTSGCCLIAT